MYLHQVPILDLTVYVSGKAVLGLVREAWVRVSASQQIEIEMKFLRRMDGRFRTSPDARVEGLGGPLQNNSAPHYPELLAAPPPPPPAIGYAPLQQPPKGEVSSFGRVAVHHLGIRKPSSQNAH